MSAINPDKGPSLPPPERDNKTALNSPTRRYIGVSSGLSTCMRVICRLWNRFLSFLYNALSMIRSGLGLANRHVVHQKEEDTYSEFVTAVALDALSGLPHSTKTPSSPAEPAKLPLRDKTDSSLPASFSTTALPAKVPPHKPIPEDVSLTDVSSFYVVAKGQAYKRDFHKGDYMKPTAAITASVDSEHTLENYAITTLIKDERLDTIAAPTDRGLLLLAAHYEHKYGINMLIISSKEGLKEALKGASLPSSCRSWGIILTKGYAEGSGHVTPILCHKAADGMIEAAVLDSKGDPLLHLLDAYPDMRWSCAKKGRQSDKLSCRTDALVILKDALINLSKHPIPTLEAFFEMEATFYNKARFFLLPSLLGRTAQISSAVKDDDEKKMATKYGESLTEFKKRHGAKVIVQKQTNIGTLNRKDGYYYKRELPKEVRERDMNLFLNYKGKANLALTKRLVAEKNPALFAIYDAKLRAFATECLVRDAESPEEKALMARTVPLWTTKEIEERMNARRGSPRLY